MTAARLREAGIADVAVLSALHGGCFEDSWSVQSMFEVLTSPGVRAWLAVVAGQARGARNDPMPAGFAIARIAADEAELLSIGVIARFRRLGVATDLLSHVIAYATERGARRLFLEVAEDNHGAQALYVAHGFTMVGRRPDYYRSRGGTTTAALTLRRHLVPARHHSHQS